MSFTPFAVAGVVSLVAVSITYYFGNREWLGPPLAAILAMPLLWFEGLVLRPVGLNYTVALTGGIVCAAALNRGRRADGMLAAGLALSLSAAGIGVVVGGACLLHNALVRPPLRRWLAVVGPAALYACWWVVTNPFTVADSPSLATRARIVRQMFLAPFLQVGFGIVPIAVILVAAYFAWGCVQLRAGRVAGANFVAWTAAQIAWPLALIRSRGSFVSPSVSRYAYVTLGFALLAIVPRRPMRWPVSMVWTRGVVAATSVVLVVGFAGARAVNTLPRLRRGREHERRDGAEGDRDHVRVIPRP